jgi:hypothetical protein
MPSSKQIEIGRKKELDQDGYSQIPDRNCQMAVESQLRPMLQHAHIGSKGGNRTFAAIAKG